SSARSASGALPSSGTDPADRRANKLRHAAHDLPHLIAQDFLQMQLAAHVRAVAMRKHAEHGPSPAEKAADRFPIRFLDIEHKQALRLAREKVANLALMPLIDLQIFGGLLRCLTVPAEMGKHARQPGL